ncbi:MAG: DNA-binding NarL/FixJ family response regulator [Acidimicrobiales bacterium]|jgi:DNA-binding NarL/FixJ family response regulator
MAHTHSLVLGVADPLAAACLRQLVRAHSRFDLVAVAGNAVQTLFAIEQNQPAVVVMSDSSPGLRGRDVLTDIAIASPNTLVIIATPGDPRVLEGQPAVAESVSDDDSDLIVAALDSLADFLDNPHEGAMPERRHQPDRCLIQDWSKVFAERRLAPRRETAG